MRMLLVCRLSMNEFACECDQVCPHADQRFSAVPEGTSCPTRPLNGSWQQFWSQMSLGTPASQPKTKRERLIGFDACALKSSIRQLPAIAAVW